MPPDLARMPEANPWAPAVSRDGYLDADHIRSANLPHRRGGAVAQHRAARRGQYGSHQAAIAADTAIAPTAYTPSTQRVQAGAGEDDA
jgi:hypothetical protein